MKYRKIEINITKMPHTVGQHPSTSLALTMLRCSPLKQQQTGKIRRTGVRGKNRKRASSTAYQTRVQWSTLCGNPFTRYIFIQTVVQNPDVSCLPHKITVTRHKFDTNAKIEQKLIH